MYDALTTRVTQEITIKDAAKLPRRVMFLRDPIERMQSAFNHLVNLELNNSHYEMIPKGLVTGYGEILLAADGARLNMHHWTKEKEDLFQSTIAETRKQGETNTELAVRLNKADYERFVDHVLSQPNDEHFAPQMALTKYNGTQICNIIYKFSEISTLWGNVFGGQIPQLNSFSAIDKDPNYRLPELRAWYSEEIATLGAL